MNAKKNCYLLFVLKLSYISYDTIFMNVLLTDNLDELIFCFT